MTLMDNGDGNDDVQETGWLKVTVVVGDEEKLEGEKLLFEAKRKLVKRQFKRMPQQRSLISFKFLKT